MDQRPRDRIVRRGLPRRASKQSFRGEISKQGDDTEDRKSRERPLRTRCPAEGKRLKHSQVQLHFLSKQIFLFSLLILILRISG